MSDPRRPIALVLAVLLVASLACQGSQSPPTLVPAPSDLPTAQDLLFPTVTPIAPGTTVTPSEGTVTGTLTVSATATRGPTATPARLELGLEDITYSLSSKRPGDDKVQMTITLHPRGGLAPYSLSIDGGPPIAGLTYTFDWHNCGQSEPHSVAVFSADGQKTRALGFIPLYDCR